MSRVKENQHFAYAKNKDADQLRGNHEADQPLCFRYKDSRIPLLPKSEIPSLQLSYVVVQPGLCRTWLETLKTVFLVTYMNLNATKRPFGYFAVNVGKQHDGVQIIKYAFSE